MRGQVFEIEGERIFTFGGGYSIDREWRIAYRSWWPQELPSDEEMQEAIRNLERVNMQVDYILTHTAPEKTIIQFLNRRREKYCAEEKPLNNFLEWVAEKVKYKHWYMGHFHEEEDFDRNQTVLCFQVRNMETNELL